MTKIGEYVGINHKDKKWNGFGKNFFCLKCKKRLILNEVTEDKKCSICGKDVFNDNEIMITFLQTGHGWNLLHDFSDWVDYLYHENEFVKSYGDDIRQAYTNLRNILKNKGWIHTSWEMTDENIKKWEDDKEDEIEKEEKFLDY